MKTTITSTLVLSQESKVSGISYNYNNLNLNPHNSKSIKANEQYTSSDTTQ